MAATGSVPAVPPLWTGKVSGNYEQSLRAMTINVARQFHQEHRMGSIEFGKIANMTVYDCDFLHDDIAKVAQANIVATIIDGKEVYKA